MHTLQPLKIKNLVFDPPFILGGMGVSISNSGLAAACANTGMGGTIASVGLCGSMYKGMRYVEESSKAFIREIRQARELSKGVIGVNILFALTNFDELVRTAAAEKVDFIISGAGLPLHLPELLPPDSDVCIIPVVSSGKAADVLIKRWQTRYQRLPDAIVVEGALGGGHLGVKFEEVKQWTPQTLLDIVRDVVVVVAKYETDEHPIPVIAAGGLFDGEDIARAMRAGARGVVLATRFLATEECPLPDNAKQALIDSTVDDMILIKSPVGLPGRALKNKFIDRVLAGQTMPSNCFYHCLKTCDPDTTPYCIGTALLNAVEDKFDDALIMAGYNAYKLDTIVSVKDLVELLVNEANASLSMT